MNKYREGKVKRTAVSGVKQNLKLCAYNQSEGSLTLRRKRLTACLLENDPASYSVSLG